MKGVIMAGGKGTRLWPISRKDKPKQFQSLVSDITMLQETFLRLRKKFKIEDIYVSTNKEYVAEVEKQLPSLPKKNIIGEFEPRGSASSVALTAAIIASENENELMALFPSDHLVKNPDLLISALGRAEDFIKENKEYIVAIAVKPISPETGFGYIKKGQLLKKFDNMEISQVEKFVEKPDLASAKQYLESGEFFWNSAIYVCNVSELIKKYKKYIPDTYTRIKRIMSAYSAAGFNKIVEEEYPLMDKVDFAYSIVENDNKVAVLPIKLEWSDIGSWAALKDVLSLNKGDNFIKGEHMDFGSENLLVFGSSKLITTIGLKDLIIIETEDSILICDRHKSQQVGEIVKKLEESGNSKLT